MAVELSRGTFALVAFALGACIGSFVNVVAYRFPRELSIVMPRSFCPHCRASIPFWANIPLLSYLMLRGRCGACGAGIPFRYFLTELALASAAAYLYLNFAIGDAFARYLLCTGLFIAALIDYDWRVIPNFVTWVGIPIGVLMAGWLMPEVGWRSSLIGMAIGAGFLFITGEAYFRLRGREGVGMGDVWLLGMIGAFLGWPGALFTLFAGSLFGTAGALATAFGGEHSQPLNKSVAGSEALAVAPSLEMAPRFLQTEIPFGPFLALAAGIFALFQPAMIAWYLH